MRFSFYSWRRASGGKIHEQCTLVLHPQRRTLHNIPVVVSSLSNGKRRQLFPRPIKLTTIKMYKRCFAVKLWNEIDVAMELPTVHFIRLFDFLLLFCKYDSSWRSFVFFTSNFLGFNIFYDDDVRDKKKKKRGKTAKKVTRSRIRSEGNLFSFPGKEKFSVSFSLKFHKLCLRGSARITLKRGTEWSFRTKLVLNEFCAFFLTSFWKAFFSKFGWGNVIKLALSALLQKYGKLITNPRHVIHGRSQSHFYP